MSEGVRVCMRSVSRSLKRQDQDSSNSSLGCRVTDPLYDIDDRACFRFTASRRSVHLFAGSTDTGFLVGTYLEHLGHLNDMH